MAEDVAYIEVIGAELLRIFHSDTFKSTTNSDMVTLLYFDTMAKC